MQLGRSTGVCFTNLTLNSKLAFAVGGSGYLIVDYHTKSSWLNILFIHYFFGRASRSDESSNVAYRYKAFKTKILTANPYTIS